MGKGGSDLAWSSCEENEGEESEDVLATITSAFTVTLFKESGSSEVLLRLDVVDVEGSLTSLTLGWDVPEVVGGGGDVSGGGREEEAPAELSQTPTTMDFDRNATEDEGRDEEGKDPRVEGVVPVADNVSFRTWRELGGGGVSEEYTAVVGDGDPATAGDPAGTAEASAGAGFRCS